MNGGPKVHNEDMKNTDIRAQNIDAIVAYLVEGESPATRRMLGFELEHFSVEKETEAHVAFEDSVRADGSIRRGIQYVLEDRKSVV